MNIDSVYLRKALIASVIVGATGCASVNSPVDYGTKRSPREVADQGARLLQELVQYGQSIGTVTVSDGIAHITFGCGPSQCGDPVQPNYRIPPHPPVDPFNFQKAVQALAAIGALNVQSQSYANTQAVVGNVP
jgi:hypothetical protein